MAAGPLLWQWHWGKKGVWDERLHFGSEPRLHGHRCMLLRDPRLDDVGERRPQRRVEIEDVHQLLIVSGKVIEATAEELRAGLGRDKRVQVRAVDAEQERALGSGPCAHEYCERGEQQRVVDLVVDGVQPRVGDGGCNQHALRLA